MRANKTTTAIKDDGMFDRSINAHGYYAPPPTQPVGELFLVNKRNDAFARGQVEKPAPEHGLGCMMVFLLPFVLAGVMVAGWAVTQWCEWALLSYSGATTTGSFVGREIKESDDSTSYYLSYGYIVDDHRFTRKDRVSYETYRQAGVDVPIQVLYYTSDPSLATVDLNYQTNDRTFATIFALFWNGFVGLMFFGGLSMLLRNIELARKGRVTFGEITHITSHYDGDNDYQIEVKYLFNSPTSGQVIHAKHKFQDNGRKGEQLPKAGAPIALLFADDKTYRML
jgi:hypothetical protein